MVNHSSMDRTAALASCCFAMEPKLADLLHDPMTVALMKADRVDHGTLEVLIAGARANLRWHRPD